MPEVGQPIKAHQPPLWEYRRDDGSGWTDHVRLDVDDLGQVVLSVLNDHDEWDEVVLDTPRRRAARPGAAGRRPGRLRKSTLNGTPSGTSQR